MQASWKVDVDRLNRTVHCRMSGIYDEDAMRKVAAELRKATEGFRGRDHVCLADMRGMRPSHPSVAAILGEAIGWQRRNGVVLCAHVSDDTVQRLQAARVARQSTAGDDVTVDCADYEEAKRVVKEATDKLMHSEIMPVAAKFVPDPTGDGES